MTDSIYSNGTYAARNPGWHSQDSDWKASHLYSLLKTGMLEMPCHQEMSLVEVGCGYGGVISAFARLLRAYGIRFRAMGCDIAAHAVEEASKRHPEVQFVIGDLSSMPERCDLGLVVDLLEHLEDPVAFLTNARTRFTWTVFHIPLDEHWNGKAYRPGHYYQYLKEDRGHIHYFTKASAFQLLRDTGFRVVRWKYTPWGLELYRPGGSRSAPVVRLLRATGMRLCPDLCESSRRRVSCLSLCHRASLKKVRVSPRW